MTYYLNCNLEGEEGSKKAMLNFSGSDTPRKIISQILKKLQIENIDGIKDVYKTCYFTLLSGHVPINSDDNLDKPLSSIFGEKKNIKIIVIDNRRVTEALKDK